MRPRLTRLLDWPSARRLAKGASAVAASAALLLCLGSSSAAAAEPLRLIVADSQLAAAFRQIADDSFLIDDARWPDGSSSLIGGVCRREPSNLLDRTIFVFSKTDEDGVSDAWRERLSIQGFRTLVVRPPRCGDGRSVCPETLHIAHETLRSLQPQQRASLDVRLRRALHQLHLLAWSPLE
ncbi:MAG: hypothetical protein U0939_01270 [Pirellulales bacterium]